MQRNHAEIVACAMCNFEAKEKDFLDTHSFTCEMFKCHNCQSTFNLFQDIKTHMSKEHNVICSFWYYKINIVNPEFYGKTYIFAGDILRKRDIERTEVKGCVQT